MNSRKARVEHALRDALVEAIAADIRDPRVHAPEVLTIARVELNVDMAVAHCYVSIVANDAAVRDAALAGLERSAGFLRGPLARRLGLARAPELRFIIDPSIDMADKLAKIVREDEDRARAVGRGVAAPDRSIASAGEAGGRDGDTEKKS